MSDDGIDRASDDLIRRAIRDAFVAGCEAVREKSLFTAGQYADRETPRLRTALARREAAPAEGGMLWQCKDYADGWISFPSKLEAMEYQAATGCAVRTVPCDPVPPLYDRLLDIAESCHSEHDKIHLMLKAAKCRDERTASALTAQEAEIQRLEAENKALKKQMEKERHERH